MMDYTKNTMKINFYVRKVFLAVVGLVMSFFIFPSTVHAQITCDPSGGNAGEGIQTAIGCVPFGNTNLLTKYILRWGIGIAGGIAFILMIYAAFLIITSSGDPKKLASGKELLVAALSGLLLLLFSVFLLRLIGQDILNIPGF